MIFRALKGMAETFRPALWDAEIEYQFKKATPTTKDIIAGILIMIYPGAATFTLLPLLRTGVEDLVIYPD